MKYIKRVGKSVISVCKKAQRFYKLHFMAVRKSRKRSGFVIYSCLKDTAFTAVKKGETRYEKGVPFVNKKNTKVVLFLS